MRETVVVACSIIALGSCGKKSDDGAQRTPSAPAPVAVSPASAPTGPLSCAKLIPQALVDKYLAGYTMTEGPTASTTGTSCKYSKAADAGDHLSIVFRCDDALKASMQQTIDMAKNAKPVPGKDTEIVTGLGAGAILAKMQSPPATNLTVWDDDTRCMMILTAMGSSQTNVQAFAKDLVATVTPASLH